jgi:hypothetical protein
MGEDEISYQAIPGIALSITTREVSGGHVLTRFHKSYTVPVMETPWKLIGYVRGYPVEALCEDQSILKIKSWIEDCQEDHLRCLTKGSRFPTRVIDVGCTDNDTPILYISKEAVAEHAALSHC